MRLAKQRQQLGKQHHQVGRGQARQQGLRHPQAQGQLLPAAVPQRPLKQRLWLGRLRARLQGLRLVQRQGQTELRRAQAQMHAACMPGFLSLVQGRPRGRLLRWERRPPALPRPQLAGCWKRLRELLRGSRQSPQEAC